MEEVYKRFLIAFDHLETGGFFQTRAEAATKLDVTPQRLSHVLKGRNEVGIELLHRFCKVFNINLDYIFYGRTPIFSQPEPTQKKKPGIPYFNLPAKAGIAHLINDEGKHAESYFNIPGVKCDFFINVSGHSMHPRYKDKDIIGCKIIDRQSITWGKPYLVCESEDRSLKYLHKKDDKTFLLTSENPAEQPFTRPMKNVLQICSIVVNIEFNPS